MDAGIPEGKETNSAESAAPPRRSRWLPAVSIAASGVLDVALLRYAVDLLAPLCATVLFTHSVRDALGDWLAGDAHDSEPDSVWVLGVLGLNLFATVLGLLSIFSTSSWMTGTRLAGSIPAPMVRMANLAEEHGWGRRAVLRGGPVDRSQPPLTPPAGMAVEATRRPSHGELTGGLVGSSARAADAQAAGTAGQATTTPDAGGQETGSIRTTIALASSTSGAARGFGRPAHSHSYGVSRTCQRRGRLPARRSSHRLFANGSRRPRSTEGLDSSARHTHNHRRVHRQR